MYIRVTPSTPLARNWVLFCIAFDIDPANATASSTVKESGRAGLSAGTPVKPSEYVAIYGADWIVTMSGRIPAVSTMVLVPVTDPTPATVFSVFKIAVGAL